MPIKVSVQSFVLSLLFSTFAYSFPVKNPRSFTLGFDESVMASTGIALRGSDAGGYYNPARLGYDKKNSIYQKITTHIDYWSFTNSDDLQDNSTVTVSAVPEMAFVFNATKWNFGFSILTTQSSDLSNELTESAGTISKTTLLTQQEKSVAFVASSSYFFSDKFSIGVSFVFDRYNENRTTSVKQNDSSGNSEFTFLQRDLRTVAEAYLLLGALLKPIDWLTLGLRLQTPGVEFQGESDHFESKSGTDKGTAVDEEISDVAGASQDVPFDLSFGSGFHFGSHHLYLDLGLQFSSNFRTIDGSERSPSITERVATKATLRFGLGYQWQMTELLKMSLGFRLSPSSVRQSVDDLEFQETLNKDSLDVLLISGGLVFNVNQTQILLGGFFNQGTLTSFDGSSSNEVERESVVRSGGAIVAAKWTY